MYLYIYIHIYIYTIYVYIYIHTYMQGFPGSLEVKNPPANTRDRGSIPGLERSRA